MTIKCTIEILDTRNQNHIISRVGANEYEERALHHAAITMLLGVIAQVGVDAVGLLRVDVTDSGVGIDLEDQSKVFGEFNQFNRNALQGGGMSMHFRVPCTLSWQERHLFNPSCRYYFSTE